MTMRLHGHEGMSRPLSLLLTRPVTLCASRLLIRCLLFSLPPVLPFPLCFCCRLGSASAAALASVLSTVGCALADVDVSGNKLSEADAGLLSRAIAANDTILQLDLRANEGIAGAGAGASAGESAVAEAIARRTAANRCRKL